MSTMGATACRLAGVDPNSRSHASSCLPSRSAAMDSGLGLKVPLPVSVAGPVLAIAVITVRNDLALGIPIGIMVLYDAIEKRISASSPQECWPDGEYR